MTKPIHYYTITGTIFVSIMIVFTLIFWPILAFTFEAGLLVGLFLHSAHTSSQTLPDEHGQNL